MRVEWHVEARSQSMIPGNFDISKQVCDSERVLCCEGHDGEDNYRRDVRMRVCISLDSCVFVPVASSLTVTQ